MTNLNLVILAAGTGEQNFMQTLIFMGVIVVVFYFFMIRPQMKRRKELAKFRNEMKQGDKVMTIGGIQGKINAVKENSVIIESEGTLLKLDKNAIIKDSTDLMMQR